MHRKPCASRDRCFYDFALCFLHERLLGDIEFSCKVDVLVQSIGSLLIRYQIFPYTIQLLAPTLGKSVQQGCE